MIKSIQELNIFLINQGIILHPCSVYEVNNIEKQYNIILPAFYKEFLLSMGRGAGSFMKGSSVFYDELFELSNWANELIIENNLPALPDKSFVFWMHQVYQMAFFLVGEDDNPFVYYFSEGKSQTNFIKTESTFIKFLEIQLEF